MSCFSHFLSFSFPSDCLSCPDWSHLRLVNLSFLVCIKVCVLLACRAPLCIFNSHCFFVHPVFFASCVLESVLWICSPGLWTDYGFVPYLPFTTKPAMYIGSKPFFPLFLALVIITKHSIYILYLTFTKLLLISCQEKIAHILYLVAHSSTQPDPCLTYTQKHLNLLSVV